MRRYTHCSPFLGFLVGIFLAAAISSAADDNDRNFILLPVTTDLQRMLLSPTTSAYCIVNANALVHEGTVDPTALDLPRFRAELATLAERDSRAIAIYCQFQNWQQQPEAEKQLEATLKQHCRDAGFQRVATGRTYTGEAWQQQLNALSSPLAENSDFGETATADENVRVFPAKTKLSRLLTGNADCVAFVRRPIDGRMIEIPEDVTLSIRHCLTQARPAAHKIINLRVTSTTAGRNVIEAFIDKNGSRFSPADELAKTLGFEFYTVAHVPCGGAPETLLGKPAPDFSLDGLDGRTIQLQDHIRGKAALVTFWGVACGPCRVEAPHLSALYEKYQGAGFTLLAVNAYDETAETVAEYVKKESLVYPVALRGREVAHQKYSVGAYPTTFWIDREGFVIDYSIGFDPGDEVPLAATVERLLKPTSPESP